MWQGSSKQKVVAAELERHAPDAALSYALMRLVFPNLYSQSRTTNCTAASARKSVTMTPSAGEEDKTDRTSKAVQKQQLT